MKSAILLVTLLFSTLTMAQNAEATMVETTEDYQEQLQIARENDQLILLVISDDESETALAENLGDSLSPGIGQQFVIMETEITSALALSWLEIFPLGDLPALYFLNQEEILLDVRYGERPEQALFQEALQKAERYNVLSAKFTGRTLDAAEWREMLDFHALNFPYYQTQMLATEFFNSLNTSQLWQKENYPYLNLYATDLEHKYARQVFERKKQLIGDTATFDYNSFYSSVYSFNLDKAIISEDSVLLEKIIADVIPHNPDTAVKIADLKFETRRLYAEETDQFNIWAKGALEYYRDIKPDSLRAEAMFEEAYAIADNFETTGARKASYALAAAANKISESFRYRMLQAFMAYQLENYTEAENLVNKARALSDNPINQRKAEGLLSMIQRAKDQ